MERKKSFKGLLKELTLGSVRHDVGKIEKAWEFARIAHYGQKRLTGEDYVYHPLNVAIILAGWKLDDASIIAALLHDTIEDCGVAKTEIAAEFGADVAELVDGVTKVSHIRLKGSRDQEFVENLRKIFLVMARDLRVVLIKLGDRLHNMRTLYPLPEDKRMKIALETLEVYAPLAERLGMGQVKAELDDLAFEYAYEDEFRRVNAGASEYFKKTGEHIEVMKKVIGRSLTREGVRADIHAREKHLYSLWRKLQRPSINWDFGEIHDIVAMRVIVEEVAQCYVALGVVHSKYKPVPHLGVSDFIAQPKPNGYRSIHTKVFGPGGRIVEVQIRTREMNEQAEYGVAAHWAYSDAKMRGVSEGKLEKGSVRVKGEKLLWVKQLVQWQKEIKDTREFLMAVKFDAFNHRNFVFSPKGDVYDLPSSATPVDFAFAVHTDLGKYIKGAKVNGKFVPLDYKLSSGDVVEIIKSKNPRNPSRGWLEFVVTTAARRKIKREVE